MPRPQRPHQCSWNRKLIEGLYHCPDGRWRINSTGQKFTEPDERLAVERFLRWKAQNEPAAVVTMTGPVKDELVNDDLTSTLPAPSLVIDGLNDDGNKIGKSGLVGTSQVLARYHVPEHVYWQQVREDLITRPEYAASMTGLAQVATWKHLDLPTPSIRIAEIIAKYEKECPASDKAKREAVAIMKRLQVSASATTLDDLTTEKLLNFRRQIETKIAAPSTRVAYYGRIKTIIAFGRKVAMDHKQIDAALSRCSVLWTKDAIGGGNPNPIGREDFHTLLADFAWRPWLLLGLNLCMSIDEVCGLKWDQMDLDKGVYATLRAKTESKRIPRAAVLWSETIAALKALPRKGPYVFTSSHGTRYNRNTRVNDFKEVRETVKLVNESITFSSIRDAAYTAAMEGAPDERWARVLAGHKAPGLTDRYVLRNPECTRPACDAVYRVFGPF